MEYHVKFDYNMVMFYTNADIECNLKYLLHIVKIKHKVEIMHHHGYYSKYLINFRNAVVHNENPHIYDLQI